jgi:hypothetical protein
MAKAKTDLRPHKSSFSDYKFDTSTYLILDKGIHRDSKTGRLMTSAKGKELKPKK